ncbi:hypothetical protein AB0N81_25245 [Streptomyces sp. NPDC093510]|uniref:hypothetical protein n=1 Tax=Streptomyces sp. NPDC093510 TaxID=3155199 RepID=UPI003424F2F3
MMIVLLCIAVLIAAAGLGAVVWAARGGPRWVRGVAKATVVSAELVSSAVKKSGRGNSNSSGSSGSGGSDGD